MFRILILVLVLLAGCRKSRNGGYNEPSAVDSFAVPAPVTVKTNIFTYSEGYPYSTHPFYVHINGVHAANFNQGCYKSGDITVDKFSSVITVDHQLSSLSNLWTSRIAPLSVNHSYIDVDMPKVVSVGFLTSPQAGYIFNMPEGGTIEFAPNSIAGGVGGEIYSALIAFDTKKSFLQIPHLHADFDNKRWFLNPMRTYLIKTPGNISSPERVRLNFPIPTVLNASAPDSLQAFHYSGKNWIKKGFARKNGNSYSAWITQHGLWSFAIPVKGFYTSIKVRTSAGVPVINTIIRVLNARNEEVAAARTNGNGDAICLLPANEDLSIEVLRYWSDAFPAVQRTSVGKAIYGQPFNISVLATHPALVTVGGTAKYCDGRDVKSGVVSLTDHFDVVRGYVPIVDGKYSGAFFLHYANHAARLTVYSYDPLLQGSDSSVVLPAGTTVVTNLNTCISSTYLFASISIDGSNSYFSGDASNSNNPVLNGHLLGGETTISMSNGSGSGLQFSTYASSVGVFPGAGVSGLFVNGQPQFYDVNKPCIVTFTRYDPTSTGYIEGSVDLYYKENNVSKHLTASFRVKRVF